MSGTLLDSARAAVKLATARGAGEAAATASRARQVALTYRDGKVEKVSEAVTRSLSLDLYVDGRYSQVSTSDLRDAALASFVEDAVAMARTIAPDAFRKLPDPTLYVGRAAADSSSSSMTPEPARSRRTSARSWRRRWRRARARPRAPRPSSR